MCPTRKRGSIARRRVRKKRDLLWAVHRTCEREPRRELLETSQYCGGGRACGHSVRNPGGRRERDTGIGQAAHQGRQKEWGVDVHGCDRQGVDKRACREPRHLQASGDFRIPDLRGVEYLHLEAGRGLVRIRIHRLRSDQNQPTWAGTAVDPDQYGDCHSHDRVLRTLRHHVGYLFHNEIQRRCDWRHTVGRERTGWGGLLLLCR